MINKPPKNPRIPRHVDNLLSTTVLRGRSLEDLLGWGLLIGERSTSPPGRHGRVWAKTSRAM
jgi:hypothetical protein